MKRIAIAVAALLALVLVGAAIFIATLDLNAYKPEIEARVEAATGRTLDIGGDLELALSLEPAVAIGGVKLSNSAWGSEPSMISVARIEATVDVLALLVGEIRVRRVLLDGAHVVLERDAQGRANWAFEPTDATAPRADATGGALPPLDVSEVRIERARIRRLDARTGTDITLTIEHARLYATGAARPIAVEVEAALADEPLRVAGEVGALAAVLADRTWPVSIAASYAGVDVTAEGTFEHPLSGGAIALDVGLEAASTEALAVTLPGVPALGPVSVRAHVAAAAPRYVVSEIEISLGESDLAGEAEFALDTERPSVSATLRSNRLDLDALLPREPAAPASTRDRLIPDAPIPVEALRSADARITLAVARLVVGGTSLDDLAVMLALDAGRLTIEPRATLAGGTVEGVLSLDGGVDPPAMKLNLAAAGVDGGRLVADLGRGDVLSGAITEAAIELHGSGAGTRAVAASLDGRARIVVGEGRLDNAALGAAGAGVVTELIGMVNPLARGDDATAIECAVVRFDVRDGLARTEKGIAFETDKVTVVGSGTVDLRTEALDLGVKPEPREGVGAGSLASLVRLGGTLAKPVAKADAAGAVAAGASVGAALATGGLSVLAQGLLSMVSDGPAPCAAALGEPSPAPRAASAPASAAPAPAPVRAAENDEAPVHEKVLESASEAVEGIGGAIKGLFGN